MKNMKFKRFISVIASTAIIMGGFGLPVSFAEPILSEGTDVLTEDVADETAGQSEAVGADAGLSGNSQGVESDASHETDEVIIEEERDEPPEVYDETVEVIDAALPYDYEGDNILLGYTPDLEDDDYESLWEHMGGGPSSLLANLPSKYDPVFDPASYTYILPATRNQDPYGSCWAHAAVASAEINLVKNKKATRDIDLSELQLIYFAKNSPKKDSMGYPVEDGVTYESSDIQHYNFLSGGNNTVAKRTFANWIGLGDDKDELSYENCANTLDQKFDEKYAYLDRFHLKNYYNVNIKNLNEVKLAIIEYGALATSYWQDGAYSKSEYYSKEKAAYYCDKEEAVNHGIAVVGWDDTFSKENFNEAHRPAYDGAWLIRNSWKVSDTPNYSQNQYFWMSYYDATLTGGVAFEFDDIRYSNNYYHDGSPIQTRYRLPAGSEHANVFEVRNTGKPQSLDAVSFETENSGIKYTIDIYLDPESGDPTSGRPCPDSTTTGETGFEGYYTVELNKPVSLEGVGSFSVVVKFEYIDGSSSDISFPIEGSYTDVNNFRDDKNNDQEVTITVKYTGISHAGQSYFRSNGNSYWWDRGEDTVKGNFRIKAFTVNMDHMVALDPNGGETDISSIGVANGRPYGKLPTPARKGYTFDGWYTEKNGGTKLTNDSTVDLTQDITLYAHWTANTYTAAFDVNVESGEVSVSPASKTVTFDSSYGELPAPSRTGYTFDGWYTDASEGTKVEAETKVTDDSDHTLYAHWTANTYTVTFDANAGTDEVEVSPESRSVTYDSVFGRLPIPVRAGYGFAGWYTAAEGGDRIDAGTKVVITENITLHAHWEEGRFTVFFDANGGFVSTTTILVTTGEAYGTLPVPTRDGYNFLGWYTKEARGDKVEADTIVDITSHQTLYAHWEKISESDSGIYTIYEDKDRIDLGDSLAGIIEIGNIPDKVYTGSPIEPLPKVKYTPSGKKAITLKEGIDYRLTYSTEHTNVGTATVTVCGIGHYRGKIDKQYNIKAKKFSKLKFVAGAVVNSGAAPTQEELMKAVLVLDGTNRLSDKLYTVSVISGTNKTLKAAVSAVEGGNYDNSVKQVKISVVTKKEGQGIIAFDDITVSDEPIYYTGSARTPSAVTVNVGGIPLTERVDYTLKYSSNKNAGTAYVTVTGKGKYAGRVVKPFEILGANENMNYYVQVKKKNELTYNGKLQKPAVVVKASPGSKTVTLKKNRDYIVTYNNNLIASDVTAENAPCVNIRFIGNYNGVPEYNELFAIHPQKISKAAIKAKAGDGIIVTYNKKVLVPGVDYKYMLDESTVSGRKAYVVFSGLRNFAGSTTRKKLLIEAILERQ